MRLTRKIEYAVVELNRKYSAALQYAETRDVGMDADTFALMTIQEDLERINTLAGQQCLFDSNYSCTWGFNRYGIYDSLDEMQEVAEIIDGGF